MADAGFSSENFLETAPGYIAIIVEALSSSLLHHTQSVLLPSLGSTMATTLPMMGGFLLGLTVYVSSRLFVSRVTYVEVFYPYLYPIVWIRGWLQ
jgi:hypothetical protein